MRNKFLFLFLLLISFDIYSQNINNGREVEIVSEILRGGITLGTLLAAIISWDRNKSVLWMIIHSFFSWIYVIYYLLIRE